MEGSQVLADRGYDSQKLIDYIYDQGAESNRHPLNVWKMKNPAGKYWKRYVLLRCIWHCPVLQWGYCRAFPSVLPEVSAPADTLPEDAFQGAGVRSCCHVLSAETFFQAFRKTAGIAHNTDNSATAG